MQFLKRSGWYYLNNTIPVPVNSKSMYYRQRIHSSNPGFESIDPKYFQNALKHESLVPMGERGLYVDFDGTIPTYEKVENKVEIKVPVKEEVVKKRNKDFVNSEFYEEEKELVSKAYDRPGEAPKDDETLINPKEEIEKPKKKRTKKVDTVEETEN